MGGTDQRDFLRTSEIRLALDPQRKQILIAGIPPIGGIGAFALVSRLVGAFESDLSAKRAPEGYRYIGSKQLERELDVTGPTLRRRVIRFRYRVAGAFQEHAGLTLSGNAVIQSVKWQGYRLNPAVRLVAADQVEPPQKRHDTPAGTSRLGGQKREEPAL